MTPQAPLRGDVLPAASRRRRARAARGSRRPRRARPVSARAGCREPACPPAARCSSSAPGGRTSWNEGAIHLVRVGTGDLPDKGVFGDSLTTAPGGDVVPATVLLASGAGAFDRLPALSALLPRLQLGRAARCRGACTSGRSPGLLARESRAQAVLGRYGDLYALSGPDSALLDARAKGRVAAERMVLIGGEVSALMLGFALVCAIGLRRGLSRRAAAAPPARRAAAPALARARRRGDGAARSRAPSVGVAGGALAVVLLAAARRACPAARRSATRSGRCWAARSSLAAWLAATAAVLGAAHAPRRRGAARRACGLVDVAALGALAAVGLGLARGGLERKRGLGRQRDAAPAPARAHLLRRRGRRRPSARPRDALAPSASRGTGRCRPGWRCSRSPARPRAPSRRRRSCSSASASRSSPPATARRSSRARATRRRTPSRSTSRLTEGSRLVLPLDAAPAAAYARLAPGRAASIRSSAGRRAFPAPARASSARPSSGSPPTALARLHWRSDFSAASPAELARRLGADGPAQLRGVALPPRCRDGVAARADSRCRGPARSRRRGCRATASCSSRSGREAPARGSSRRSCRAGLRQIVGLEISLTNAAACILEHREAEGVVASAPAGHDGPRPAAVGHARPDRLAKRAAKKHSNANYPKNSTRKF